MVLPLAANARPFGAFLPLPSRRLFKLQICSTFHFKRANPPFLHHIPPPSVVVPNGDGATRAPLRGVATPNANGEGALVGGVKRPKLIIAPGATGAKILRVPKWQTVATDNLQPPFASAILCRAIFLGTKFSRLAGRCQICVPIGRWAREKLSLCVPNSGNYAGRRHFPPLGHYLGGRDVRQPPFPLHHPSQSKAVHFFGQTQIQPLCRHFRCQICMPMPFDRCREGDPIVL